MKRCCRKLEVVGCLKKYKYVELVRQQVENKSFVNGETVKALLLWPHHPTKHHFKKHHARHPGGQEKMKTKMQEENLAG